MFTARDREKCEQLCRKYYAGRRFYDHYYRDAIFKYLRPDNRVLDAGCGQYLALSKELSQRAWVVGIDLEERLETDNLASPFGVRADVERLPFPDAHFDMVVSRSVIEHLEDPPQVFREVARVMRPGGILVIVTPNKFDYVSVIASITPYRLHRSLVSRILHVSEDDVFPTLYRANTPRALRRALRSADLHEKELHMINHYPAYLTFSPILFRMGVLYERLTSLRPFRSLCSSILCVYQKPGTASSSTTVSGQDSFTGMHREVS